MKRIILFLLLVIPGLATRSVSALAVENSSSQTQTSVPASTQKPAQAQAQSQAQALPQITSQVVLPIASQEAIAACSGLYEKDSCQFHTRNALVNGACKILPSGNNNYELGCQPEQSTKNAAIDPDKDTPNVKEPHQHKHKRG